jgi:hypothetical protein
MTSRSTRAGRSSFRGSSGSVSGQEGGSSRDWARAFNARVPQKTELFVDRPTTKQTTETSSGRCLRRKATVQTRLALCVRKKDDDHVETGDVCDAAPTNNRDCHDVDDESEPDDVVRRDNVDPKRRSTATARRVLSSDDDEDAKSLLSSGGVPNHSPVRSTGTTPRTSGDVRRSLKRGADVLEREEVRKRRSQAEKNRLALERLREKRHRPNGRIIRNGRIMFHARLNADHRHMT